VREKASTEDVLFVEEISSIEMLGSEGREEKDEREGSEEGPGSGGRPGTWLDAPKVGTEVTETSPHWCNSCRSSASIWSVW
jgi:hypothetical protein